MDGQSYIKLTLDDDYSADLKAFVEEVKAKWSENGILFNEEEVTVYAHGETLYVLPCPLDKVFSE